MAAALHPKGQNLKPPKSLHGATEREFGQHLISINHTRKRAKQMRETCAVASSLFVVVVVFEKKLPTLKNLQ